MGGIKINRDYGRCFICLHVKELQRDGSLQGHPLERSNPRGERCPGGGRLPRGNGESYRVKPHGEMTMDFADALKALRDGKRVSRYDWANTPQGWLILVPGSEITVEAERPLGKAVPDLVGNAVTYTPHIDMYSYHGELGPWTPTQADLLANDWNVW
jgi:hypothetical protein